VTDSSCLLWLNMANHITQKTFDDVVRENIADFEMDPQEAIDDAVKQFEAQVKPHFCIASVFHVSLLHGT